MSDVGQDSGEGDQRRQQGLMRLAREVGVNLIANLIAAATIYLVGALGGLLPRSPAIIGVAIVVLAGVLFLAGLIITTVTNRDVLGDCLMFLGVMTVVIPITVAASMTDTVGKGSLYLSFGLIVAASIAYFFVFRNYESRKKKRADSV